MRSVTTSSYSDTRQQELANMMAAMVNNHWAVLQGDEKIEVLQTNGTTSAEIFDRLIAHRDSKISKRVLGQDGTTDGSASGTYGSLKVFQDVAEDRHNSDKTDIRYLINKELFWRLEMISPAYAGITKYKFDWDESKELSPKELVDSIATLSNAGYEVDYAYITEKTGIPIKGLKYTQPEEQPSDPAKEQEQKKKQIEARFRRLQL
jgi:phage gp29-like protein